MFYQNIALLGPITLYIYNWTLKITHYEPYNAVDTISMRHDICYRDNDTPVGKRECDRKMLAELNVLLSEGRREKVDRQLVRSIIGLKHRMGLGIGDLIKVLYSLNKSMIYGLPI